MVMPGQVVAQFEKTCVSSKTGDDRKTAPVPVCPPAVRAMAQVVLRNMQPPLGKDYQSYE